ncbi:MAG: DNA polymerase III subunit delta [Alcanivoracaceae bacterium]|nr:DNA polymerase III subunit delta [Alcanivoracaceae bacterium]
MKIYANQLAAQLNNGLQACYLIVGDEPLQMQEATDAIRQKAQSEGFTEREILHVDKKFKWETLSSSMGTMSLFAEKKIIELYIPTGKPGAAGSKAITEFVAGIPVDICLLIQCEQWSAASDKTKWVKAIENAGSFMRVYMPKPHELGAWLRNRCRKIGLNIEADTITILAMRLEGNLLAADQELEKLKMRFANQVITAKDVASLVADNARFDVFRLTDALLENNLNRVLRMIRALKQDNTPIVIIHWALERQIRTLLFFAYIKEKGQRVSSTDYRKQGVWQNQQSAIQSVLNRLSARKLEQLIVSIAKLDRIIKGQTRGDAWLALEQWMVSFCS